MRVIPCGPRVATRAMARGPPNPSTQPWARACLLAVCWPFLPLPCLQLVVLPLPCSVCTAESALPYLSSSFHTALYCIDDDCIRSLPLPLVTATGCNLTPPRLTKITQPEVLYGAMTGGYTSWGTQAVGRAGATRRPTTSACPGTSHPQGPRPA